MPPAVKGGPRARQAAPLVALALALGVLLFYSPALALPFLGDDLDIVEALYYRAQYGAVGQQVLDDFRSTLLEFGGNYYRPLVGAAFALDYTLWRANPFGYHLTNLLLHVATTVLLFGVMLRLLPRSLARYRLLAAAVGALFFALRPVNSEVVLWISGRGDSLALFGMLLAVYAYLRAGGRWNGWYALALAGFAFALGSKEPAATLPGALAALHLTGFVSPARDAVPATLFRRLRFAVRSLLPFVLLLAGYFWLRWALFGSFTRVADAAPVDWGNPEWVDFKIATLRYFLTPRFAPGWETTLSNVAMLILLGAGAALSLLAPVLRRLWLFAALWILAILVPAIPQLFVNPLGEGERLLYLPTAPLALIVASPLLAFARAGGPRGALRSVLAGACAVTITVIVLVGIHWQWERNREWAAAGVQMAAVLRSIPVEGAGVPAGQTRLLVVPDSLDGIPFGRNGQGAMMGPPMQAEILLGPLFVSAPELPCQPPGDVALALYDAKCWDVRTTRFVPFDPAVYTPSGYPRFWLLNPDKLEWLP